MEELGPAPEVECDSEEEALGPVLGAPGSDFESDDGEIEDADIEDDEGSASGIRLVSHPDRPGSQEAMLFVPGLGYVPLSSLGSLSRHLGMGLGAPAPQPAPTEGERAWSGLSSFPAATQLRLQSLLSRLRAAGADSLTLLVAGRAGAGKSTLINALLNERAAAPAPLSPEPPRPALFARKARGFTLRLIEAPAPLEGDTVAPARLGALEKLLRAYPPDAVVLVARADAGPVDALDAALARALAERLGAAPWSRCAVVLARAGGAGEAEGAPREDLAAALGVLRCRAAEHADVARWAAGGAQGALPRGADGASSSPAGLGGIVAAARRGWNAAAAGCRTAAERMALGSRSRELAVPAVAAECGEDGERDADGQKMAPRLQGPENELQAWIPALLEELGELRLRRGPGTAPDRRAARDSTNPDLRRRWLIPLALAGQVALLALLRRRMIRDAVAEGTIQKPRRGKVRRRVA